MREEKNIIIIFKMEGIISFVNFVWEEVTFESGRCVWSFDGDEHEGDDHMSDKIKWLFDSSYYFLILFLYVN